MFDALFPEVNCPSCGNSIRKGLLFCKTCGRSRGFSATLQFKEFELLLMMFGLISIFCFCLFVFAPLVVRWITITPLPTIRPIATATIFLSPIPSRTATWATVAPTYTSQPTKVNTPRPTSTPKGIDFSSYSCPDKSKVQLRVGLRAEVQKYDMNLRSAPVVPDVWDANIVIMLRPGDRMTIIGGPRCAHDGTWWDVKTDRGYNGWVRELQPNKILLKPIQ